MEDNRSARKRKAIIEAAAAAFLQNGYLGTNMDEIATAAAVSKQTVYKHFADKERLFAEIIYATIGRVIDELVRGATSPCTRATTSSATSSRSPASSPPRSGTPTSSGCAGS